VVYPWKVPPGLPTKLICLCNFLGASRDGLVTRPVEMDKLSSTDWTNLVYEDIWNPYDKTTCGDV
jgi:hypothetical protein